MKLILVIIYPNNTASPGHHIAISNFWKTCLLTTCIIVPRKFPCNDIFCDKIYFYNCICRLIWIPDGELVAGKFNECTMEDPHFNARGNNCTEHGAVLLSQLFRSVQSQYGTFRHRACLCTKPAITSRDRIHRYQYYRVCTGLYV